VKSVSPNVINFNFLNAKTRHSQRGLNRGYKTVDAVKPVKKKPVDAKVRRKALWVEAGLNWTPRPVKRTTLVDKLDQIVSLIVRDRDKRCVQCGSREKLTNGHVLPGRYYALRWDIRPDGNCHTQCWPCNYSHVNHQSVYYEWYIDKFGLERFKQLRREYYGNERKVFSDLELRQLYEKLMTQYGHLLHGR
jgi:hypothetical protein